MKPSSCFINIGRGTSAVEDDLIEALQNNIIEAASLDVFHHEPLSTESKLWEMENVYITPHTMNTIDNTEEYMCKTWKNILNKLIKGDPLPNLVQPKKGY